MLKLKREKYFASEQNKNNNLLSQRAIINARLEQNRVLGIRDDEKYLNQKLEEIENLLKKKNVLEAPKSIPYGGIEMDGGNLKDKATEDLLRIQTIQIYKLLQKSNDIIQKSEKSNQRIKTITDILTFWLVLSILSIIVAIIYAVNLS